MFEYFEFQKNLFKLTNVGSKQSLYIAIIANFEHFVIFHNRQS